MGLSISPGYLCTRYTSAQWHQELIMSACFPLSIFQNVISSICDMHLWIASSTVYTQRVISQIAISNICGMHLWIVCNTVYTQRVASQIFIGETLYM